MKLGGITLDRDLYLDPFSDNVTSTAEQTIDGETVVFSQTTSGQSIDLIGYETSGWLTYGVLKQLHALSNVAGALYTLELADGTVKQVRFRHEEKPAVDMTPIVSRSVYDDDDYFYGTIKLAEVK